MFERLNLNVSAAGEEKKPQIMRQKLRSPMMSEVINWITSLHLGEEVERELIKKVKNYPLEAMYRFRERLDSHIAEIQTRLQAKKSDTE